MHKQGGFWSIYGRNYHHYVVCLCLCSCFTCNSAPFWRHRVQRAKRCDHMKPTLVDRLVKLSSPHHIGASIFWQCRCRCPTKKRVPFKPRTPVQRDVWRVVVKVLNFVNGYSWHQFLLSSQADSSQSAKLSAKWEVRRVEHQLSVVSTLRSLGPWTN